MSHVEMWENLIEADCCSAAAGLIEDMLTNADAEEQGKEFLPPELGDIHELVSGANAHWIANREDAMVMLGDQDGSILRTWWSTYKNNYAFLRLLSLSWVQHYAAFARIKSEMTLDDVRASLEVMPFSECPVFDGKWVLRASGDFESRSAAKRIFWSSIKGHPFTYGLAVNFDEVGTVSRKEIWSRQ